MQIQFRIDHLRCLKLAEFRAMPLNVGYPTYKITYNGSDRVVASCEACNAEILIQFNMKPTE